MIHLPFSMCSPNWRTSSCQLLATLLVLLILIRWKTISRRNRPNAGSPWSTIHTRSALKNYLPDIHKTVVKFRTTWWFIRWRTRIPNIIWMGFDSNISSGATSKEFQGTSTRSLQMLSKEVCIAISIFTVTQSTSAHGHWRKSLARRASGIKLLKQWWLCYQPTTGRFPPCKCNEIVDQQPCN